MELTKKEKTLLFEVARIAYEGCGMWLTGLADDNYSWFRGSEIMSRLKWDKERTGGVMASLTEKGVVGYDDGMVGIAKMSFLNIRAEFEKDHNGEWFVTKGNDLYNVFEGWEKDYHKYCENPFIDTKSEKKTAIVSRWIDGEFTEGRELTEAEYKYEKQCQEDDFNRHLGFMDAEKIHNDRLNDFIETFDI